MSLADKAKTFTHYDHTLDVLANILYDCARNPTLMDEDLSVTWFRELLEQWTVKHKPTKELEARLADEEKQCEHCGPLKELKNSLERARSLNRSLTDGCMDYQKKLKQAQQLLSKVETAYEELKEESPKSIRQIYDASTSWGLHQIRHYYYLWRKLHNKIKKLRGAIKQ